MLEHHVLRRMDAREHCVMSGMKPSRRMTTANNEGGNPSYILILKKTWVLLRQGATLAPLSFLNGKLSLRKPVADYKVRPGS